MPTTYKKIIKDNIVNENNVKKISDNITRNDIANYGDASFFNTVNISFDNNKYVNAMFINTIKDKENSDFSLSNNIEFNKIETSVKISNLTIPANYYSTEKCTDDNYNSNLNYFFLIVDEIVPSGCDITYFLLLDDNRKYVIKPNGTTPLILKNPCKKFRLYCRLTSNGIESPEIKSYAILYYDEYVESAYRLINIDLSENDKDEENQHNNDDIITLIRDNTKNDKLIEIITSADRIKLKYDLNERLSEIESYDISTDIINSKSLLKYEQYINSAKESEEVLTKIITKNNYKK